ncbi:MobF family relaxase [Nonomuraea turcica]|uniref:MobF family relaxase n=1 Tax=Nonomuraea sp. G32 TaxID=3067274 RepID=UPI00273CDD50|nr:MobF family relaxase [Nonomuraea sp. G32]MDP4504045.1 MobF family relaxase [Nonomuraea sp. G32]
MAWVTVLGPDPAQIDYRLREGAGCDQVTYRLADGAANGEAAPVLPEWEKGHGLTWIGAGLAQFGIDGMTVGAPLTTAEHHQAARRLMDGCHPDTGEQLVEPKKATSPLSQLAGEALLAALQQAAAEHGGTVEDLVAGVKWAVARAGRLERGVARRGAAYKIPIGDAERLAAAAGLDLDALYDADRLEAARAHRDARVQVGNRGYDVTLDLPKSVSVWYGLADPELAQGIEDAFAQAVADTVAAIERWAGYGIRGQKGDGKLGRRVEGTGLAGWIMWHRSARPTGGQVGDPHLHAHVVLANMTRCVDGAWGVFGDGGRDLYRHDKAVGTLVQARLRRLLTERYGIAWTRDPRTGAWEIAGIGAELRELYSKRGEQVAAELLGAMGLDDVTTASTAQRKMAGARTREAKNSAPAGPLDTRASWRAQARAAGHDPAAVTAACLGSASGLPERPSPAAIAAWIWRPDDGLTGHTKIVSRADVLAEVMDALPDGVANLADADALTDQVLRHGPVVHLATPASAVTLTNGQCYTSTDVTSAEQIALAAARAGYGAGLAVVDPVAAELAMQAFEAGADLALSDSQRAVLARLLGDGHAVEAVIGVAGAGKTTLMSAARSAWESRGLVVAGAATAAVAAMGLAAESGITSSTIASWLRRIERGPGLDGIDVLVVDEAAIADDRHLAALLTEARRTATKTVLIGDPVQLRAIGVGGTFAAIHRQVDGLLLSENRRQRHLGERAALALWRDGQREEALRTWSQAGRVHAGRTADDTMAAMLTDWQQARLRYAGDVHAELAAVALLAGSNADVDRLNHAARALRRAAGELSGPEVRNRQPGGRTLALAVGDHVRIHTNDYRARRGQGANVLNGYRGRVMAFDAQRRVLVEWRAPHPDGPRLEREWITPGYIAAGGLSHGTAMTVAATQGATVDRALVYGYGLDPHSLYAAMSRDREAARLYLPRELLESDADRARLGEPDSYAVELDRALAAYAATLQGDRADRLVTAAPEPIAHQRAAERAAERDADWDAGGRPGDAEHATPTAAAAEPPADPEAERARRELQDAEREARAAVERASALLRLTQLPLGVGLLTDAQLDGRVRPLAERVAAAAAQVETAEQHARRYARDGGGPAERALEETRARLAEQLAQIEAAERAATRLQQARQTVLDSREQIRLLGQHEADLARELDGLGRLRPAHRARRRELGAALPLIGEDLAAARERLAPILAEGPALEAAARRAAAAAPPAADWPLIRRHQDLERDVDAARRTARARDVDAAAHRAAQARHVHDLAQQHLAALQDEHQRRADLPPDERDLERAARAEHAKRQRAAAAQLDGPTRPTPGLQLDQQRQPYRPPPPSRGVDRGPGLSR